MVIISQYSTENKIYHGLQAQKLPKQRVSHDCDLAREFIGEQMRIAGFPDPFLVGVVDFRQGLRVDLVKTVVFARRSVVGVVIFLRICGRNVEKAEKRRK